MHKIILSRPNEALLQDVAYSSTTDFIHGRAAHLESVIEAMPSLLLAEARKAGLERTRAVVGHGTLSQLLGTSIFVEEGNLIDLERLQNELENILKKPNMLDCSDEDVTARAIFVFYE